MRDLEPDNHKTCEVALQKHSLFSRKVNVSTSLLWNIRDYMTVSYVDKTAEEILNNEFRNFASAGFIN